MVAPGGGFEFVSDRRLMGHFQLRIDSGMNCSPARNPFNGCEMPLKWPYVTEQRSNSGKLVATA
jgi:hypothetical protein